ncbi:hypothetical protein ES703_112419 [subsurface metagenome]
MTGIDVRHNYDVISRKGIAGYRPNNLRPVRSRNKNKIIRSITAHNINPRLHISSNTKPVLHL